MEWLKKLLGLNRKHSESSYQEHLTVRSDFKVKINSPMHTDPSQGNRFEEVGNIDAVCPHCNQVLQKKPGRKKKCPHCGQFIYVRARPCDQQQVLVTEAQADQIEEQWSIVNGVHDAYLSRKHRVLHEKAKLSKRFGHEPSDRDVRWSLLNEELLENMQQGNWGNYRNVKLQMAEILSKDRIEGALRLYLEICYLDLNGPQNIGGIREGDFLPWDPSSPTATLAPGIINRMVKMIQKANLDFMVVEPMYTSQASALHSALRLPLSPAAAWPQIRKALFD